MTDFRATTNFVHLRAARCGTMGKNLVLCADGTCNAFGAKSSSNVARLIEYLARTPSLGRFYDEGPTANRRWQARRDIVDA